MSNIKVLDEPDCGTVYLSDGDMFMGHQVAVSFSGKEVEFVELIGYP